VETTVTGAVTRTGGTKDAVVVSHNHTGTTDGNNRGHNHGISGDGNHNHLVVNSGERSDTNRFTNLVDNGGVPFLLRTAILNNNNDYRYALKGTGNGLRCW